MMLDYLGQADTARHIENALYAVYRSGRSLTRDLGGTASTAEFTAAIIGALG
jgi:isocitrate dehydrogenase (NAD+)